MRSPTYAALESRTHAIPPAPMKVDYTNEVVSVSAVLLVWAVCAMFPHSSPYHSNLFLNLTLASWSTPLWVFAIVGVALLLVLVLVSSCGHARPLRLRDFTLAVVALSVSIGAGAYVLLLNVRYDQEWTNGRLKLCVNHCGSPYRACVHDPVPVFDARASAERAADAVAFFGASVFGAPVAVAAHVVSEATGATRVVVVYGDTGKAKCTAHVAVPDNGTRPFMLAVDGLSAYSRTLAERYGWSGVSLPPKPPSACGLGGQIANEAAAANAVAAALQAHTGRDVAIYGCSRSGKIGAWAAATKPPPVYTHALVDSGGTLGLASARQVGRCGEPMAAMVDRWPSWLARNASRVRDVSSWPANLDVGDLVLGACAAGTRFAVSTSRNDLWNNGEAGLAASVEAARAAGCAVRFVLASGGKHCGLF